MIETDSSQIQKALNTISGLIIELQNLDLYCEIVEEAKTAVNISNQMFWKAIVNNLLLKFQEFTFDQLIDIIYTLD